MNKSNPADALSDFDLDGLTALQEHQLGIDYPGYGKPLGKWSMSAIPRPTGFTTATPSVTLIEVAGNGTLVARVQGILTGTTVSTSYPYTWSSATGWVRVANPAGYANINSLTPLDVNSSGQVVGYFNSGGTKGFLYTPGANGGQTTAFYLNPGTSQTLAIPKRISDAGYITGNVGNLNGRSIAATVNGREITFANLTNPTYQDVNSYGEFVGTVYNPFTFRNETFLACEGFPVYQTGIGPDALEDLSGVWGDIPDIDPDAITWVPDPTGYGQHRAGTAIDRQTQAIVNVHEGYGASFYWESNYSYYGGAHWWYSYPGFSQVFGAVNDWGEFAGLYSGSMAQSVFDSYGSQTDGGGVSDNGIFFYEGSYHISKSRPAIYSVSNDPRVLIGTPFAIWSGSQVVPITTLIPAGNPTAFTSARLADNGQVILQGSPATQIYILKPNQDVDGDGMPDDWEKYYGFDPSNTSDASTDADNDGYSNLTEFKFRTNPKLVAVPGSPGQFIDIRPGIDTDGDGLPNVWEWKHGLNYNDASDVSTDADHDGLTNLQEFRLGTKMNDVDSDGDGVSDWDEIMANFTNPFFAADDDEDGIADDFEKHLAKQLLDFQPDPAYWNGTASGQAPAMFATSMSSTQSTSPYSIYDQLIQGDLDPDHDYTGENRTLGEYAAKRLKPWSSITAEAEWRMTATIYGSTGIEQKIIDEQPTTVRAFGTFSHDWYDGAPSTQMTKTIVPDAAWYVSWTELLPWNTGAMQAFDQNDPLPQAKASHDIQITTDLPWIYKYYPGRYEQRRIRIWGPKLVNDPATYNYLIVTERTDKGFGASSRTFVSAESAKLEIKRGHSSSDWLEIKPILDSSPDYAYVVSLVPVGVKEVSFDGTSYHKLTSDDASVTYGAPQWNDLNGDSLAKTDVVTGEKNYPVAFTRGSSPKVRAKFKIGGLPAGLTVKVKATSTQAGVSFTSGPLTPEADGMVELPLTQSTTAFASSIQFYNATDATAFEIKWELAIGNGSPQEVGKTKHTLFLTLADPLATLKAGTGFRETLFWLACANAIGETGTNMVGLRDKIYIGSDRFSGKKMKRFSHVLGKPDGQVLQFISGGVANHPLDPPGKGVCGNWAQFLVDVLAIHAIAAKKIDLTISPSSWPPNQLPASVGVSGSGIAFWAVKGAVIKSDPGIWIDGSAMNKGQGDGCKVTEWPGHSIVRMGNTLMDPSYGISPHDDPKAYEDEAIQGYRCEKITEAGGDVKSNFLWHRAGGFPSQKALLNYPP